MVGWRPGECGAPDWRRAATGSPQRRQCRFEHGL